MAFPRIIHQTQNLNASNNLASITINPNHPYYGAQLAQERYEFSKKWKVLLIGLFISFITGLVTHWVLGLIGYALTAWYILSTFYDRKTEIMGHAIEISVANQFYGVDESMYRLKEANDLVYGYDRRLFDSVEHVVDLLVKAKPKAQEWVFKNLNQITKDIKDNV